MSFVEFFILIGVFIVLVLLYRYSGTWIKKLDPKTVKTVNWIGFIIGLASGTAWYFLNDAVFMFITFFGVIIYFLFYDYDKKDDEGQVRL